MSYPELKKKAIFLRKKGYSYNLISEKINISKSTLHYWLAKVPYIPNSVVRKRIGIARAKSGEVKHRQKLATFIKAKELAMSDIGSVSKRDLFMLGIGIYIGEGEKNETVGIINSDPRIIKLTVRWFQEICGLGISNLTLAVHLYPDNNEDVSLRFWSKVSGIPLSQFGKTQTDRRVVKTSVKRGKLTHGTAHLRVRSNGNKDFGVLLSRRIRALMDIVLS